MTDLRAAQCGPIGRGFKQWTPFIDYNGPLGPAPPNVM